MVLLSLLPYEQQNCAREWELDLPLMYNTVTFGVIEVTNEEEFDGLNLVLKVCGYLFTSVNHHKLARESKAVDKKGAAHHV